MSLPGNIPLSSDTPQSSDALSGDGPVVYGDAEPRRWGRAIFRGLRRRCPECGRGALFAGYIKTNTTCDVCSLDISGHRADDGPPYLTILLVGHIAIPLAVAMKQFLDPPLSFQFLFWTPVIILMTAFLLPRMKGALIGLQWAHEMHGFAGPDADPNADV
ncbi:MAG: DUF983 domain-containing protein [Pseudomonadota bacterium]